MYYETIISVAIAFFAAAGAIPLLKNWFRKDPAPGEEPEGPWVPRVAGIGILFGIFISLFYVGPGPLGATGLLVAGTFLAACGVWLVRRGGKAASEGPSLGYELGASIVAVASLVFWMPLAGVVWTPVTLVLAAMALVTPAAMSFLGRAPSSTPALPPAVALVQLLLLVLLGLLDARHGAPAPYGETFAIVALPVIGALMGALIYLCRMPWRRHSAIASDVATLLCLGLVLAWGALRLGLVPEAPGTGATNGRTGAILWVLAVPVFELLRRCAAAYLQGTAAETSAGQSPASMCIFTLILGGVGILLWRLRVPEHWTLLALILAFLVYALAPVFMPYWSKTRRSEMADARG